MVEVSCGEEAMTGFWNMEKDRMNSTNVAAKKRAAECAPDRHRCRKNETEGS